MGTIEEIIIDSVKKSLEDGLVESIITEKVQEAVKDAVKDAFRWSSNDVRKTLDRKIQEFLIPVIEKHDFSALLPKMDTVLTGICNSTALMDNKKLLENFQELMIEPEEKTVTVSELFKAYKKYVASDIDTDGREVVVEERPEYKAVNVKVEVEEVESYRSSWREMLVIHFTVEDEEEDISEALNRDVMLWRFKKTSVEGYEIDGAVNPEIRSLRFMNQFELLLTRLARAGVQVLVDVEGDDDYVTPDNEPEASYS